MSEPSAPPDPLPAALLRWRCDPNELGIASTAEVEPAEGIVGQPRAVEALEFGLEIHAPGQNVYVRGLAGTGRLTLVRRLLEEIGPSSPTAPDYCYVHNFDQPDRPRLLRLPRATGEAFRDRMRDLQAFITEELAGALNNEFVKSRRTEIERVVRARIEGVTDSIEEKLDKLELGLFWAPGSGMPRPIVVPKFEGQPLPPDKAAQLRAEGRLTADDIKAIENKIEGVRPEVESILEQVAEIQADLRRQMRELLETEARRQLQAAIAELRREFPDEGVGRYLDEVVHDVTHRRLPQLDQIEKVARMYEVNLLVCRTSDEPSPVVVENAPSVRTLIGTIDALITPGGGRIADHMDVHAGSLLRADGGVLILEAAELLAHPGAWRALVRTLRSGRIEMIPPDQAVPWMAASLKPEPIHVHVKVVLLGDTRLYYLLDEFDPDFPNLFKVLADFDHVIPRDAGSVGLYAGVLAKIVADEGLPPFLASGVAAIAEHGARIAAAQDKLTAQFGRLADIAREAAYIARREQDKAVDGAHVSAAIRRTKRRADGPARRFRELIAQGDIRIATTGSVVGQINGLAVIHAGPLTYGFPTRITTSIGPGVGGAINIERESQLSGAIHTKAFYILGGLLRRLLPTIHPLTFEASIAFEQSYGGIDGDSASAAEICCLLSALTKLPISQGLAMTGAIDQMGNVLPIGAVNEKVEGFYDTCALGELDGRQGVIIPRANVSDLMLRTDIVELCEAGRFHVYAVDTIHDAIALFFGKPSGVLSADGSYRAESVLGCAMERATDLWRRSSAVARAKPGDEPESLIIPPFAAETEES